MRVRSLSVLVVLALGAVVACSGDDDSDSSAPAVVATGPSRTEAIPATTPGSPDAAVTGSVEQIIDSTPSSSTSGDFDPYAQRIEWSECEYGECVEVSVPIDYEDPSAGTTTIAMSRMASTGSDPIGTLFINPGGPGIAGIDRVLDFQDAPADELLANYHVVGFDPRGVGASDAITCLDETGLDEFHAADLDPTDQSSVDAYLELLRGQGEACLANSPELAQHVTTIETAKDMDVMRALVGDDQMNYFGFSYGTFLGTTYAALFPEKVGRMVLDGPEDPSLGEVDKTLRSMAGFQLAFDDYAADCVENECPLGGSVDEINQQVAAMFETAKGEPIPTDDPDRALTRPLAFYGIVASLYAREQWPQLTEALSAGLQGDGTFLLESADDYLGRNDGTYLNRQVITAINCLDAQLVPSSGTAPTEDDFLAASPVFGAVAYGSVAVGCDQWPIHPTVTAPDYSAPGAAPILVVGTTGDPATPIENAQELAASLESGVLLIRVGEGHTAYFQGNACITETVNAYLIDGTVPDDGTECAEPDPAEDDSAGAASQGVTLLVGEDVVLAEWTECTWDGTSLTLTASGDGVEIDATTGDDGTVNVTVSGDTEVTVPGVAEDVEGTLIVTGTATTVDGTTADALLSLDVTNCS
jgi:pimeloyl-ACP methyl ester carboxylesterase